MNQAELSFDSSAPPTGYDQWQTQRRETMLELARQLGLPLGHEVEVWLRGGVRLRGRLRLREECLFVPDASDAHLQLVAGDVPFTTAEMESCVRTDS